MTVYSYKRIILITILKVDRTLNILGLFWQYYKSIQFLKRFSSYSLDDILAAILITLLSINFVFLLDKAITSLDALPGHTSLTILIYSINFSLVSIREHRKSLLQFDFHNWNTIFCFLDSSPICILFFATCIYYFITPFLKNNFHHSRYNLITRLLTIIGHLFQCC